MAAADNGADSASRISKGTRVSGKISFQAPATIDGEADGEISGGELVVSEGAIVNAHIVAARLIVAGTVRGEILAQERVELLPTARVRCRISTPQLILQEGALFDGDCMMPRNGAPA